MNDFEFIKELGAGSFGRVIKVRKNKNKDKDNEVFAMKQIKLMQLSAK